MDNPKSINPTSPPPAKKDALAVLVVIVSFVMLLGLIGVSLFFIKNSIGKIYSKASSNTTDNTDVVAPHVDNALPVYDVYDDVHKVQTFWAESKYPEMFTVAQHILSMAKTNEEKAQGYYWTGVYYYQENMLDKAIENENLVIKLEPTFVGPYVTLGSIYSAKGDRNKAFDYEKKAVELGPENAWAHNGLGLAYYDLGDKVNAIKEIKEAIRLDPDTALFRLDLKTIQGQ